MFDAAMFLVIFKITFSLLQAVFAMKNISWYDPENHTTNELKNCDDKAKQ